MKLEVKQKNISWCMTCLDHKITLKAPDANFIHGVRNEISYLKVLENHHCAERPKDTFSYFAENAQCFYSPRPQRASGCDKSSSVFGLGYLPHQEAHSWCSHQSNGNLLSSQGSNSRRSSLCLGVGHSAIGR